LVRSIQIIYATLASAMRSPKLHMFVAIDRTGKRAFVELHDTAKRNGSLLPSPADRSSALQVHAFHTDKRIQSTDSRSGRMSGLADQVSDREWRTDPVAYVRTRLRHQRCRPSNHQTQASLHGQVERTNRTIRKRPSNASTTRSTASWECHFANIVVYNFAKRLKSLRGLRTYEYNVQLLGRRTQAPHLSSAPPKR
jgi:hypothetical protein